MSSSRSPNIELRPEEAIDTFLEGRLQLIQSIHGYRFSIDAIILAEFVTIKPGDLVIDLGTGCGIMLLILLAQKKVGMCIGLEIQPELASQAARNAKLNGFEQYMQVIVGDLRKCPIKDGLADVVICNPPYRKAKSGRINPDLEKAIARHELLATLDDILAASSKLLKPKGRLAIVYPSERMADLLTKMRNYQLEPKRVQLQYPSINGPGKLLLVESALGARPGIKVLPPLVGQGNYSICT